VFDAVSPAAGAADMVLSLLFDPERAARLVQQHALDPSQPSLESVLDRTIAAVFAPAADPYHAEIARAVQRGHGGGADGTGRGPGAAAGAGRSRR